MTKLLKKPVERKRPRFNPNPTKTAYGVHTLVQAKSLRQHCLSSYYHGVIALGISEGAITKKEADIFENCFIINARLRKIHEHHGYPFFDLDSRVMEIMDSHGTHQLYDGSSNGKYEVSTFNLESVRNHPKFFEWRNELLFKDMLAEAPFLQGGVDHLALRKMLRSGQLRTEMENYRQSSQLWDTEVLMKRDVGVRDEFQTLEVEEERGAEEEREVEDDEGVNSEMEDEDGLLIDAAQAMIDAAQGFVNVWGVRHER